MSKTGTVTGLSVGRAGWEFVCTWTCVKKSVDQRALFWLNGVSVNKAGTSMEWSSGKDYRDMAKGTNSKSVLLAASDYYPYTATTLNAVGYSIRAKADGKSWGDWSSATFWNYPPNKPIVGVPSMYNNLSDTFVYTWAQNDYDGDNNTSQFMFTRFVYETVLMDNGVQPNWALANTQKITILNTSTGVISTNQPSVAATLDGSVVIVEDQDTLAKNKVRYFHVKAQGPAGDSIYTEVKHVYGSAERVDLKSEQAYIISSDSSGTSASISFHVQNTDYHPIDSIEYQYAVTTPTATVSTDTDDNNLTWKRTILSLPNDFNSWTTYTSFTGSGNPDVMSLSLPNKITDNCCLFVRVNTKHDGATTEGVPLLVNNNSNSVSDSVANTKYVEKTVTTPAWVYGQKNSDKKRRSTAPLTKTILVPVEDDNYVNGHINTIFPSTLSAPTLTSIETNETNYTVQLTVGHTSGISGSFIAVYYRAPNDLNPTKPIGIIPYGTSTATIQAPAWGEDESPVFGIRSFVADYTPTAAQATGVTYYTLDNIQMHSPEIIWDDGTIPKAPTKFSVVRYKEGVALATWDWTWDDANNAEVSWADNEIAWESTDSPSVHNMTNLKSGRVYITGLTAGTWYFRVRLYQTTDESTVYGAYSKTITLNMSAAPNKPTLVLSSDVVAADSEVTAYWSYESNDGTAQAYAKLAEATMASGATAYTYTQLGDAVTNSSTQCQIKPSDFGWTSGAHNICVRVTSDSGQECDDWSNPVVLNIVPAPMISVSGIGGNSDALRSVTIPIGEEDDEDTLTIPLALRKLPLEFSVSGAGVDGLTSYSIKRVGNHDINRPDDADLIGYDGEIVVAETITNTSDTVNVSITKNDILTPFDYMAKYQLNISITDKYGQTDKVDPPYDFTVVWDHCAVVPTATFQLDHTNEIAKITPVQPTGYSSGDTCDVYRLSTDAPQLIGEDLSFGVTYVDPFPTYGRFGGYRIVYKSKYGDTKTEDNEYAWKDYSSQENNLDYFKRFAVVINYDDNSIELPGNVSLSSAWSKDFQLTRYLGGSMKGDWNAGVQRTGTIKATIPIEYEPEAVASLRRLADYAGVCHVRTPEGSNFYANVDVNDDREEKWVNRLSKVSISFTRVDNDNKDLMEYADWISE